jgi:hypothetical protein
MISYTDVAMVAFLTSLFNAYPVVYAHPDVARQRLAAAAQTAATSLITETPGTNTNIPPNMDLTVGFPGVAVFRTSVAKFQPKATMPMADTGYRTSGPINNNFRFQKTIPVNVWYSVECYARKQSQINDMERILWFSDVYQEIELTVPANAYGPELHPKFYMAGQDQSYTQGFNKDTGLPQWFQISKKFRVESQWIVGTEIPIINSVSVGFYENITCGGVITPTLIEQFTSSLRLP